jgi:predicted nucleotidyltransferase
MIEKIMTLASVMQKREEILELTSHFGLGDVRVFGSIVRGESDALSDVDFLVKFGRGFTFLRQAELTEALEQLLGCRVDIISEDALRPRLKASILQQAQPL